MFLWRCFFFLFAAVPLNASAPILSVEDCVCLALRENPDIKIADFKALQAAGQKNLVRSIFFPHLDADGVIDNSNRSLAGELTQFQDFRSTRAIGFSAQLGLYDFGASWKRFKAMKLRLDATEWEKMKVILEVEKQVRITYYRVLECIHAFEVMQGSKERLMLQKERVNDLYSEGNVRHSDVLAVQVQLTEAEKNALQAEHDLELAWIALNRILNFSYSERFGLVDVQDLEPCCIDFKAAFQHAAGNRPDLIAFGKELEALTLEKMALRRSVLPNFYAFANTNIAFGDHVAVSAGLGMKMPIYHGGAKCAEKQILESQIGEVAILIEETRKNIDLEIREIGLKLEEINRSHDLNHQSIGYAEQNVYDNERLYQKGMVSMHDLLLAQEQLDQARLGSVVTIYQQQYAFAHFFSATGGCRATRRMDG